MVRLSTGKVKTPISTRHKSARTRKGSSNLSRINPKRLTTMNLNTIMNESTSVQTVFSPMLTHGAVTTRKTMRNKNHTRALQWTVGNDPDDLEAVSEGDKIPMEYRLMVAMLLEANSDNGNCDRFKNIEFVKDFTKYFKNSEEYSIINLFKNQSQNIKDLYKVLNLYPKADKYVNNEIHLYRGFDGERYELLLEDMPKTLGKTYTTPTFLSTSVLKNTGLRFAYDNGIVWKIVIPKRKLGAFNYTNLSNENVIIEDEGNTNEAEILLNMGAKLKLKDIEEIENDKYIIPQFMGSPIHLNKTYTLYTFEFIGYEKPEETQKIIKNTRDTIMSCFSEQVNGKKLKTKKNNKKNKKNKKRKRTIKKNKT